MKLTIATFLFSQPKKWRQLGYETYSPRHVNALWRACADNIKIPHRFICYADKPDGIACENRPSFERVRVRKPDGISLEDGCYQRLRLYDPGVQKELGTEFVAILDLDLVFMRDATELFERAFDFDFTVLVGSAYQDGRLCNHYNGSIQICRSGARPQFWRDFDTKKFYWQRQQYKMPGGHRPKGTDQAWLSVCSGNAERTIGPADGCYQYRVLNGTVPDNAVMLFFSGRNKPWSHVVRQQTPDVAERWSMYNRED